MGFKYGKPRTGYLGKYNKEAKKAAGEEKSQKQTKPSSFSKQVGIKYKKQSTSPQLWETSRSKHIKRGKSFFGIR